MKNIDVLVIGRSCLDYIAVVKQFPGENKKVPLEFRLMEGGGQGGTTSCCISKLGGRVAYVGKLGDDAEGRFCLQRLKDFGVGTEFVEVVKGGKTPVAYIFVTAATGARTIIYEHNALPKIVIDATVRRLMARARVLLLDPEVTYLGRDLKGPAGGGVKVVYDGERWRPGIENIMAAADYFVPTADFLDSEELQSSHLPLAEKMGKFSEMIAGRLIVTHGEQGAYYLSEGQLWHVAVAEVNAVDTIGAGDNFHAAFALALARGDDIHQSVKFSVAVASLSCRKYGGRNGIPNLDEAMAAAAKLKVACRKIHHQTPLP